MMMFDWIQRLVTLIIYIGIAFGFSIELPKQFCDLIGVKEDPAFTSCKWQVFGFRIIFILLSLPVELLMLAVVYRHATDLIFKINLREVTGVSDFEKRHGDIGYLIDPNIEIKKRESKSFASGVEMVI